MNEEYLSTFGKRVRLLRDNQRLSQKDLVSKLNRLGIEVSQGYLSKIENSERMPSGDVVAGLARILGCTADYLLMLTNTEQPVQSEVAASPAARLASEEAIRTAELVDKIPSIFRGLTLRIVEAVFEETRP